MERTRVQILFPLRFPVNGHLGHWCVCLVCYYCIVMVETLDTEKVSKGSGFSVLVK